MIMAHICLAGKLLKVGTAALLPSEQSICPNQTHYNRPEALKKKKKDVQTLGSKVRLNGSKSWSYQDAFHPPP